MTKERILQFRTYLRKAYQNRLTRNVSICSYYLMCPKNGLPMQITYNAKPVGKIENGVMTIYKFDKSVWRESIYKYDLLHEIKEEYEQKESSENEK